MIAYVDRNVLSRLRRRSEDEVALRAAIKRGDHVFPLGIVTLSETLLMDDKAQAFHEIRWIVGLTWRRRVVNDTVPTCDDCVRAYAFDGAPPSPYVTTLDLARVTSPTPRDKGVLLMKSLDYKPQRTRGPAGGPVGWVDLW